MTRWDGIRLLLSIINQYDAHTWKMARTTQSPPMTPTSTHGKMLHMILPSSSEVEFEESKKLLRHVLLAVECREAEMMIQTNATENAAKVIMLCNVMYLRYMIGFSYAK
jgi:hypothetical protein